MGPDGLDAELDILLAAADAQLARHYPGPPPGRQPVHTVYVPADRVSADLVPSWGRAALGAAGSLDRLGVDHAVRQRVRAKLAAEPIEDLRVDCEDGYGVRPDDQEDRHVTAAATALRTSAQHPPFVGVRIKSLEPATRRRAVRSLAAFLDGYGRPFTITLPKVSHPDQVRALVLVCERLEASGGLAAGSLRFEIQVELPAAVLSADGVATVSTLISAADGRCTGLHYGTYDYSAALGIAAGRQSLEHPVADHAKAVMQVAAAGRGVWVCDGSSNVLPTGSADEILAAQRLHARLVRRSLERGFYQGWDLHPGQLPTRFAATYTFFREDADLAVRRIGDYLARRSGGILDEPATARALAGFLLRGMDCGALDPDEVGLARTDLEALW